MLATRMLLSQERKGRRVLQKICGLSGRNFGELWLTKQNVSFSVSKNLAEIFWMQHARVLLAIRH